jgi:hypothetical protein
MCSLPQIHTSQPKKGNAMQPLLTAFEDRVFRSTHVEREGDMAIFCQTHKPTVSLDIISLVASSCGYNRGEIEQCVAQ